MTGSVLRPAVFLGSFASAVLVAAILDHWSSVLSSHGRETVDGRHAISLARAQFVLMGTTVLSIWMALGVTAHTWETVTGPVGALVVVSFLTCVFAAMIEPRRPLAIPGGRLAAMLHDANGLALHRVLLAVWTGILCGTAAVTVCRDGRLAPFDRPVVAISVGASVYYLALKALETRMGLTRGESRPADSGGTGGRTDVR